MFGIFYPENNQRTPGDHEFKTSDEAISYLERQGFTDELPARNKDVATRMHPITGVIIVVRGL